MILAMRPPDPALQAARAALAASDPDEKCRLSREAGQCFADAGFRPPSPDAWGAALKDPGRPLRPALVSPRELPRRRLNDPAGRIALLHAVTHIEFNAINLAWDAVQRFPGMPADYYRDWARVAVEESGHFELLRQRLRAQGSDYGALPAHNGLWEMAAETANDPLLRMALVPRVLEARGLDVTPGMMVRLREAGDAASAGVLAIILRDEVGHVAVGSRWFRFLCEARGLDPEPSFRDLLAQHLKGRIKGPFHREARLAAGFSAAELDALEAL